MFELQINGMSFEDELQIVQADVKLTIDGDTVIEEPLCIDVGLPALLLGGLEPIEPNRFADAGEWEKMPFFVCGCGDPECRGYSFRVKHRDGLQAEWTLVEESADGAYREFESYTVDLAEVRAQMIRLAEQYVQFVAPLDYRPHLKDTVEIVRTLLERLKRI
ncbi:MAG: hypothetical protein K0Q59_46 [Paenibacillus sp.]|nr:hypothetical protein [Paenibacillus sp.]